MDEITESKRIRCYIRQQPENLVIAAAIIRKAQEAKNPCSIFFTQTLTRQQTESQDTLLCYDVIPTANVTEITNLDEYLTEEEHRLYRYILAQNKALINTIGKKRKPVLELVQTIFQPQVIRQDPTIFLKEHKIDNRLVPFTDLTKSEQMRLQTAIPSLNVPDTYINNYTIEEWQTYIGYAVKIHKPSLGLALILAQNKKIITLCDQFQKNLRNIFISLCNQTTSTSKWCEYTTDCENIYWEPLMCLLHATDAISEKTPIILKTTTLEGKEWLFLTVNRQDHQSLKTILDKHSLAITTTDSFLSFENREKSVEESIKKELESFYIEEIVK